MATVRSYGQYVSLEFYCFSHQPGQSHNGEAIITSHPGVQDRIGGGGGVGVAVNEGGGFM